MSDQSAAHSAELELVAGLLWHPTAVCEVADDLSHHEFDQEPCSLTYKACVDLYRQGVKVDQASVGQRLQETGDLVRVGGFSWLGGLDSRASYDNVSYYAGKVKEAYTRRELVSFGTEVAHGASAANSSDTVEQAHSRLLKFMERLTPSGVSRVGDHLLEAIESIIEINASDGGLSGLATGIDYLDQMTGGLQAGRLVVLAGRPAMGKTSLAMNLAANMALTGGHKVGIFSMEMSAGELTQRLLCTEARFPLSRARRGLMDETDDALLHKAGSLLHQASLYIDDSSGLSLFQLRTKARMMKSKHGLDIIFVDYLQLMQTAGSQSRQLGIAEISRGLKELARELEVPIVALSQLSRACEQEGRDGRPRLSDLRESGAIEQDADIVAFIFRECVYKPEVSDRKAELIVEKHRQGPTGTVWLDFEKRLTLFSSTKEEEND